MSITSIDIRVKCGCGWPCRAARLLALAWVVGAAGAHAEVPRKLIDGLGAPSPKVRIVAVASIAALKAPEARLLIEPLLRDPAPAVRAEAASALGKIGDPASFPALEAVNSDADPKVRSIVERVLTDMRAKIVFIFAPRARDFSGRGGAAITKLDGLMRTQLTERPAPHLVLHEDGSRKGYGASPIAIRSVTTRAEGTATFVDVKCEVTVVEMPGNILRGVLSTTASVGVEGKLNKKLEEELLLDGVSACAPELATDFRNFIRERTARR